jgi:hypothetical protein
MHEDGAVGPQMASSKKREWRKNRIAILAQMNGWWQRPKAQSREKMIFWFEGCGNEPFASASRASFRSRT